MSVFLREYFIKSQWVLLIAGVIFVAFFMRPRKPGTDFGKRESELPPKAPSKAPPSFATANANAKPASDLGTQRQKKYEAQMALPGIRLDGAPHEILGIASNATADQIQAAYRDLMKRFHPDVMRTNDVKQMKFLQDAAVKINQAKTEMLKVLKK